MPNPLICCADGNSADASTWATCDGYSNSESANAAPPTTYGSTGDSAAFALAAATYDGIALKLAINPQTALATVNVKLQVSGGADVSGSVVQVYQTDMPLATAAGLNGGWVFFKWASPIALSATNYIIRVSQSESGATAVSFFASSANAWARFVRTTTTSAPTTSSDMIITQAMTSPGNVTTHVVVWNDTANVSYGSATTSLVTPAIAICNGSSLNCGVAASTAYTWKVNGNIIVYGGGNLRYGDRNVARIPSTSSLTFTLNCVNNIDYGIYCRNGGFVASAGKDVTTYFTTLTADAAASQAILTVASTSGWSNGDEVVITGETYTNAPERKTILTVDSPTQVTLTTNLARTHLGTNPDTRCHVAHITSNVILQGVSTTKCFYINVSALGTSDFDSTWMRYIGSSTSGKYGIVMNATGASGPIQRIAKCSFTDCHASAYIITQYATSAKNYVFDDNVLYSNSSQAIATGSTTNGDYSIQRNIAIGMSNTGFYLVGFLGTVGLLGNVAANVNGQGFYLNGTAPATYSVDFTTYGNNTYGFYFVNKCPNWNLTLRCFGNTTYGAWFDTPSQVNKVINSKFLGNGTNVRISGTTMIFDTCTIAGLTTSASQYGVSFSYDGTWYGVKFLSCDIGVASGANVAHVNGDFDAPVYTASFTTYLIASITAVNTNLASSTPTTSLFQSTMLPDGAFFASTYHNRINGNFIVYLNKGRLERDTTIYASAAQSMRMTPLGSNSILKSAYGFASQACCTGRFKVGVKSGNTCTVSLKVRESVVGDGTDYDGARIKLYVERNDAAGITSDTLLQTATVASEGAFETISGTTAAVASDCELSFYVTCGDTPYTQGWINVDDFSSTTVNDTKKFDFSDSSGIIVMGDNVSGGVMLNRGLRSGIEL